MALADWAKRWYHWGGCHMLDCCCIGEDSDSSFLQCCEGVHYGPWPVKLVLWMQGQSKDLTDKPHLVCLVLYVAFGRVWFVDRYKYWACNWNYWWVCVLIVEGPGHLFDRITLNCSCSRLVIVLSMCCCFTGQLAGNRVACCSCRRRPFLQITLNYFCAVTKLTWLNIGRLRLQSSL